MKYFHRFNQTLAAALCVTVLIMVWHWLVPKFALMGERSDAIHALCQSIKGCAIVGARLQYDEATQRYYPAFRLRITPETRQRKDRPAEITRIRETFLQAYLQQVAEHSFLLRATEVHAQVEVLP